MNKHLKLTSLCLSFLVFAAYCSEAHAAAGKISGPCASNINLPAHVLYKSENVHGGRGPTLITSYGNTRQWPPCSSLNIYNGAGTIIARLGCFDPGSQPYGRRFYSGVPGGSYTSATGLYVGARRANKSTKIYIDQSGSKRRTCWIVSNPYSRQGAL